MRIKAAVFRDYGHDPAIETLALDGPQAGEVLVRIVATGVCHTDLKTAQGTRAPRPVVLGHEGAGIVEAVGAGVERLAEGDHVVMSFGSCGHCPSCLDAETAYCHNADHFGCTRPDGAFYLWADGAPVHGDFFNQSSFASHAIGRERGIAKVDKAAPLEILGPLGCGIQTGAGAVLNDFKMRPGQTLVVFGAGTLGLSAVMAARIAGAARVIALDRHPHRLQLAVELGADAVIEASGGPLADRVRDILPSGADFALDTTGAAPVMLQAIEALAPRGTFGFATPPLDGGDLPIRMRALTQGRRMQSVSAGGGNPEVFIPLLVGLHMQGRFPFDRLVRFYALEDIGRAFHDSETGTAIKPVLRME